MLSDGQYDDRHIILSLLTGAVCEPGADPCQHGSMSAVSGGIKRTNSLALLPADCAAVMSVPDMMKIIRGQRRHFVASFAPTAGAYPRFIGIELGARNRDRLVRVGNGIDGVRRLGQNHNASS